jgi:hypothetical protein
MKHQHPRCKANSTNLTTLTSHLDSFHDEVERKRDGKGKKNVTVVPHICEEYVSRPTVDVRTHIPTRTE